MFSPPCCPRNRVAVQYQNGSATFLGGSIGMVVKSNQQHFDSAILEAPRRCQIKRAAAPMGTGVTSKIAPLPCPRVGQTCRNLGCRDRVARVNATPRATAHPSRICRKKGSPWHSSGALINQQLAHGSACCQAWWICTAAASLVTRRLGIAWIRRRLMPPRKPSAGPVPPDRAHSALQNYNRV